MTPLELTVFGIMVKTLMLFGFFLLCAWANLAVEKWFPEALKRILLKRF